MPSRLLCALVAALCVAFSLDAQEAGKVERVPAMQEVSPGVYEFGAIHIDKKARSVTFPGKVNMAEGSIEYVICTPGGPTHESLLVTEVQPRDIHFAMLLLDAKGAGLGAPAPGDAPPGQINAEFLKGAPRLKGDGITMTVKWSDAAGREHGAPVEEWVMNYTTKKAASRGAWIYTGSMFAGENFLAQSDGAIASVVNNPAALINNPRKGSDNDQIWSVNAKAVPPVGTPVTIVIQFEPAPLPKPK